jgi:predicted KAP-like P-loop ATPase
MDENNTPQSLSPDKPVDDPTKDRLGYAPFAKTLADSIVKMAPPEGLVIALYGVWGSGKSTVLNFVIYYLEKLDDDDKPVIVHFNPWWFSGEENLVRSFFHQLQTVLGRRVQDTFKKITELVSTFADLVSVAPIPGAEIPKKVTEYFPGLDQTDVVQIKRALEDELRGQDNRILIVIDDIDRLAAEEIRQLFRTIKAVADFPNVVYLVAFDREVVTKALEDTQGRGFDGGVYLDKIVQVGYDLPLPDEDTVSRLLSDRLKSIIGDIPDDKWGGRLYWEPLFHYGIAKLVRTPRNLARLTNSLSVSYPGIRSEVNPYDFVAIETLRISYPSVYHAIRDHRDKFIFDDLTLAFFNYTEQADREISEFHEKWLSQINPHFITPIQVIVISLFPQLRDISAFKSIARSLYYQVQKERRHLHICNKVVFPLYFQLTIPEGYVSNAEIQELLKHAHDSEQFGQEFVSLCTGWINNEKRVSRILDKLQDCEPNIPTNYISQIVQAFFKIADTLLWKVDVPVFWGSDTWRSLSLIIVQSLHRLNQDERFHLLMRAITNSKSPHLASRVIVIYKREHEKYKNTGTEQEPDLRPEQLEELESAILRQIRNSAQENSLFQTPQLGDVLNIWKYLSGDEGEVCEWLNRTIMNEQNFEQFVKTLFVKSFSAGIYGVRQQLSFSPGWLEPYLREPQLIERLKRIVDSDKFTDAERQALDRFLSAEMTDD